ncbi:MAG: AAA family ATPase [Campylobacterota bacterium]|nr:AAA family ATPase [Campylobacterota bacterium]
MNEYFIQKLFIKDVRSIIKDLDIPLDNNERKHLIITGKNGSGKTSLLDEIDTLLNKLINNQFAQIKKIDLLFSNQSEIYKNITNGKFILAFFKAKRKSESYSVQNPTKQSFKQKYNTREELNKTFLQYLVNLKTSQAFEQIEGNIEEVENISKWFERFENALKDIFDKDDLKIAFNHKNFDFKIEYDSRIFNLNELSDGYSSFLAIFTELILRMEAHNIKVYDMQGVVLIDEIETHLHVELQKKVLPFLVSFFPKVQFIVTTHSPFVLSSLSNAIICDLEKREIVDSERFVNASYSQIVKNYFEVDSEFSRVLVSDIKRYEDLITLFENDRLDEHQEKELFDLDLKLDKISPMLSDEIYLRFKEAQEKIQDD